MHKKRLATAGPAEGAYSALQALYLDLRGRESREGTKGEERRDHPPHTTSSWIHHCQDPLRIDGFKAVRCVSGLWSHCPFRHTRMRCFPVHYFLLRVARGVSDLHSLVAYLGTHSRTSESVERPVVNIVDVECWLE